MPPKVSVIIPCFNHGRSLDGAVDSVLGQTFQDFEIIVVNDGSTDPFTRDLLASYGRPRTRVLHQTNGGVSSGRNYGIRAALGEFILTLDADDRFAATFIEKAVPILETNPEVGMVTCGIRYFGACSRILFPRGGGLTEFLVANCCPASCLFRRASWEAASGYNESIVRGYEDWDFWISVCEKGWCAHVLPEVLFFYCVHTSGSMVNDADRHRLALVQGLVQMHRASYERNVDAVVNGKEQRIQEFYAELLEIKASAAYRLGRLLLHPLAVLRNRLAGFGPSMRLPFKK